MSKKQKTFLLLLLSLLVVLSALLAACGKEVEISGPYEVYDGYKIELASGASYRLLSAPRGVSVDEDGTFHVSSDVSDHTQVLLAVSVKGTVAASVVCTVRTTAVKPTVEFTNLSSYLIDGDAASARSTPQYAVTYSVKDPNGAISVNSATGKVSFAESVSDGTQFTVVAEAKGATAEKTFIATTENYVTATDSVAIAEFGEASTVSFTLDFGANASAEEKGVLGVSKGTTVLSEEEFSYDAAEKTVTIAASVVAGLPLGENTLKIVTEKNAVSVTVKAAQFVSTAEELAAINDSRAALSGYYIMVCDIDLTQYLSKGGAGYNNGKGWNPIGVYYDVTDGTATSWSFAGTFDGNGHTVSGLYINRSDDLGYNSGLFGYVTNQGVIRNLGVRNGEGRQNDVRSFSGGFVGANAGTIENCWADVDVITNEALRVVGGFVGRNEGVITDCYSLGNASAGSDKGAFCGINLGVLENCFALLHGELTFCGTGTPESCAAFSATADMTAYLDENRALGEAWTYTAGQLPSLPSVAVDYDLREIIISNTETYITKGEAVQLTWYTNPLRSKTTDTFTFEVVAGDVEIDEEGNIDTTFSFDDFCTVRIRSGNVQKDVSFRMYDRVTAITLDKDMETVMYAGKHYRIDVTVSPSTANQEVEYKVLTAPNGVTLSSDGVVGIDRYAQGGTLSVRATAGPYSVTMNATVAANETFAGNNAVLFRDLGEDARFTLPEDVSVTAVKRYGKSVAFTQSGRTLTVPYAVLSDFGGNEIPIDIVTADKTYIADAVVYEDSTQVLYIDSMEDFIAFKNDYTLYDKTVILRCDLDFEGKDDATSVGNSHEKHYFTGVFNGNGHTVKNLTVIRNDYSGEYISSDDGLPRADETTYRYHTSFYNVGFFSYVTGVVCNVNFDNVTVKPTFYGGSATGETVGSWVGVVCGTLKGTVYGCSFTNCTVRAATNLYGYVSGKTDGRYYHCFVDGKLYTM